MFGEIDSDPLVRFSNLLEAMFFNAAIICENEADCLFYRHLCSVVGGSDLDGDVFWLSSHGKQNIRKFASILRKLGLRVMSIPDLDVINDKATLRSLFESHGGRWAEIERDVDTLLRFIGSRKRTNATKEVKGEIASILDSITVSDGGSFPRDAAAKIRDALNGASPWREIKESGIKALGKGTNQVAAKGLLGAMEKRGILVPPVGEMESFYSLSSLRSMEWVKEVLDLDVQNDDNLSDARKFAKKILAQGK